MRHVLPRTLCMQLLMGGILGVGMGGVVGFGMLLAVSALSPPAYVWLDRYPAVAFWAPFAFSAAGVAVGFLRVFREHRRRPMAIF